MRIVFAELINARLIDHFLKDLTFDVENTIAEDADGALGGYSLGRVYLFPAMLHAIPGINAPEGVDPVVYTVTHETGHGMHTFCMEAFKRLSGWIEVNDWQYTDVKTGDKVELAPDDFMPGSDVKIHGQKFSVSEYQAQREYVLQFGDEEIRFKNPYAPNGQGYLRHEDANFVSEYAKLSPVEDYAESFAMFMTRPELLKEIAPEKYEFMSYLYGPTKAL